MTLISKKNLPWRQQLSLFMIKNDLTNKEFAPKIGTHESFVGMMRRGERKPSLKIAQRIEKETKINKCAILCNKKA